MDTDLTPALNWREAGEGPAVVLLHGFPFNAAQWEPQLASPPAGWRLIAPDLPGFGASPASPGDEPYTMSAMAREVARLLDRLGVERAVICGLSMGGYVAFAFWRAFRERTVGLILCDTRATPDTDAARKDRHELAERVTRDGAAAVGAEQQAQPE
jgi:3-oxoadipate enol-lactonase